MMMLPGVIAFHLYQGEQLQSFYLAYPRLVKDLLPLYLSGFFLAVLLGAVFSSFNSLLNSAATLFVLDVYAPLKDDQVDDQQLIKVAKIASIVIALFSFVVAPLLMFAPEGLWQIIRIFTGFYNIPVIAIVLVGLFSKHVPALGAKIVVIFHVIAYALLKFVFEVEINFIHIYAILFFIEVGMMLLVGKLYPLEQEWHYERKEKVSLVPWKWAFPSAIVLLSCIVLLYVLFSPIGVVGALSSWFWPVVVAVVAGTAALIHISLKFWHAKYAQSIARLGE